MDQPEKVFHPKVHMKCGKQVEQANTKQRVQFKEMFMNLANLSECLYSHKATSCQSTQLSNSISMECNAGSLTVKIEFPYFNLRVSSFCTNSFTLVGNIT